MTMIHVGLIALAVMTFAVSSLGIGEIHSHTCFNADVLAESSLNCGEERSLCVFQPKHVKYLNKKVEELVALQADLGELHEAMEKATIRQTRNTYAGDIRTMRRKITKTNKQTRRFVSRMKKKDVNDFLCRNIDYCKDGTFDVIPGQPGFYAPDMCHRTKPGDMAQFLCNREAVLGATKKRTVTCDSWFTLDML